MGHILVSIPVFLLLSVLQTVVVSRIEVLSGSGDIILLTIISWIIIDEEGSHIAWAIIGGFLISILSAMPIASTMLTYFSIAMIAKFTSNVFWQSPILALFSASIAGTIIKFVIEFATMIFIDIPVPILISITNILLPTLLLNLFFTMPIYILMGDLSRVVSPGEENYA